METKNTMVQRKNWIPIATGVVVAILILTCIWFAIRDVDTDPAPIQIGYSPYILNLPLFVALEKDLFGPHKVVVREFSTTNDLTNAVIRGQIDLASATGTELFLTVTEESPGVLRPILFNAFGRERWSEAFLVPPGTDVGTENPLRELEGKNIGTIPASTAQAYIEYIGRRYDIDYQSIQQIQPNQALAALSQGRVDALFAVEPQIAMARENGLGEILVPGPLGSYIHDPLLAGAHVLNGPFADQNPEIARAVYDALARATMIIDSDREAALAAGRRYTGLDATILEKTNLPLWVPSCNVTRQDLEIIANLFYDAKIVETKNPHSEYVYCPETE